MCAIWTQSFQRIKERKKRKKKWFIHEGHYSSENPHWNHMHAWWRWQKLLRSMKVIVGDGGYIDQVNIDITSSSMFLSVILFHRFHALTFSGPKHEQWTVNSNPNNNNNDDSMTASARVARKWNCNLTESYFFRFWEIFSTFLIFHQIKWIYYIKAWFVFV